MIKKIFIFVVLVGLAFVLGLKTNNSEDKAQVVLSNEVVTGSPDKLQEVVKQAGAVEIKVKPSQLEVGKNILFTVTLDTHSVELSYDLAELAYVEDNLGNKYEPESWSGGKGGHHLSGELTFGKLKSKANGIKLNFEGIENEEVFFEWEL